MPSPQPAPDFPFIRAYGRVFGLPERLIEMLCDQAHRDGAPADAAYLGPVGDWVRADETSEPALRAALRLPARSEHRAYHRAALRYEPSGDNDDTFTVWLPSPGEPRIGTVTRDRKSWTALPRGQRGEATECHPTRELAGLELADQVPPRAVTWREDAGWVTQDHIADPAIRRRYGLPTLTAYQMAHAAQVLVADIADLVLPGKTTWTAVGTRPAWRPRPGQPAMVESGYACWLIRPRRPSRATARSCPHCWAGPEMPCRPRCRLLHASQPTRDVLMIAPIRSGWVAWDEATAADLYWTMADEHAPADIDLKTIYTQLRRAADQPAARRIDTTASVGDARVRIFPLADGSRQYHLAAYGAWAVIERDQHGRVLIRIETEESATSPQVSLNGRPIPTARH